MLQKTNKIETEEIVILSIFMQIPLIWEIRLTTLNEKIIWRLDGRQDSGGWTVGSRPQFL